jgi:serine/threonine protein kinase
MNMNVNVNVNDPDTTSMIGTLVNRAYRVEAELGKGEFGIVFRGRHFKNGKTVAIKMEPLHTEMKTLKHETTIMNHLYKEGSRQIPPVYWYGLHADKYTCLVMPQYLCSLYDYSVLRNINENILDEIMTNSIRILEEIHTAWVIHRDIKPQNFMIGDDKQLYLIDFGLATFYVNEYREPIEATELKQYIVGSPKYASYYVHCGLQSQRRDDLISLGYMYIFLKHRGITWDDIRIPNPNVLGESTERVYSEMDLNHPRNIERKHKKELTHLIRELQRISYNEDCVSIVKYMEYCYRLSPTSTPHYNALQSLFSTTAHI